MNKILITTSSFAKSSPEVLEVLESQNYRVVINPFGRKITEEELINLLNEHKPIGILAGTELITRPVQERAKSYLKVVSRVGAGWDNVDRQAAKELGIQVFRTTGVLNEAVAELTIGMILSALRSIPFQDRQVRSGVWQKEMGRLLHGKVVGVIGFGEIGQKVGELARAFGAKIYYHDPIPKEIPWATPSSLYDLLSQSDILTLHASGASQILGEKELNSICKPGAIVVNTARGELVNESALLKALNAGHVAYACLDVFAHEPYSGPLNQLDNVILTPHIGSYAQEARIRMEKIAVENLLRGLELTG